MKLLSAVLLLASTAALAKVNVVTTTQDSAAITRAIGGDRVNVKALAKGFQDPHFVDAKPTFMVDLNRADLFIVIGLELEIGYAPSLVSGAHNDKIAPGQPGYLDLSPLISPLEVVGVADRGQGDIHPAGNPHYWLDPENGRLMARGIAARLSQLEPEGKAQFAANLATFEKTLTEKEAEWAKKLGKLSGQPIITYHKSWTYFAARYKLDVQGFVEPKPGIPPTPGHTLELIKLVQAKGIKIILMEVFYDKRFPELIAAKSGAKLVAVPNSVGGTDKVTTYFELFDAIADAIEAATR